LTSKKYLFIRVALNVALAASSLALRARQHAASPLFVTYGLGFFLNFKEKQLFFGKIAARENPSSTKIVCLSYFPSGL